MTLHCEAELKSEMPESDRAVAIKNAVQARQALTEYLKEVGLIELSDSVLNEVCFTDTQVRFIEDFKKAGKLWFMYCGRNMFGDYCPAVLVDNFNEIVSKVKYNWDNKGEQFIIYCDK